MNYKNKITSALGILFFTAFSTFAQQKHKQPPYTSPLENRFRDTQTNQNGLNMPNLVFISIGDLIQYLHFKANGILRGCIVSTEKQTEVQKHMPTIRKLMAPILITSISFQRLQENILTQKNTGLPIIQ